MRSLWLSGISFGGIMRTPEYIKACCKIKNYLKSTPFWDEVSDVDLTPYERSQVYDASVNQIISEMCGWLEKEIAD
jgi:hypothetical protein